MESMTRKPLVWEKGSDRNQQATMYGLLEHGDKRVLIFSIRPASNDKKTGFFLSCALSSMFKLELDPTLYESYEEARSAAEKQMTDVVGLFVDLPILKATKKKEETFEAP